MTDLSCKYLGLQLKNPLIVGSSGLTSSLENLKTISRLGAGAVVLKSVFEEQIKFETDKFIGSDGQEIKFDVLPEIIEGLEKWMVQHNFTRISDFKSLLSRKNIRNPASYERVQFLRLFSSIE